MEQPHFNGPAEQQTAEAQQRLSGQLKAVFEVVKSGEWMSLRQITKKTGAPEASVSAQLRHLRKPRFGSHKVEKRHLGQGLYEYRVLVNQPKPDAPRDQDAMQGALFSAEPRSRDYKYY